MSIIDLLYYNLFNNYFSMNNYPNKCLEFKLVEDFANNVEQTIDSLMYTDDDQWGTWINTFAGIIEDKLIEIDMLLSKIKFAADRVNWVTVCKEKALNEEICKAVNLMKDLDTTNLHL